MFYIYPLHDRMGNGPKKVMAHSLGNIVVSEAICAHNLDIDTYVMLNAAIPSEAFDSSLQNTIYKTNQELIPESWKDYPSESWASRWHEHFTSGSVQSSLNWKGRYATIMDINPHMQLINCFSQEDEVFEMTKTIDGGIIPSSLKGALHWHKPANLWPWNSIPSLFPEATFGLYSWQKQEFLKGSGSLFGTTEAGWFFGGKHVGSSGNVQFKRHYDVADVQLIVQEKRLAEFRTLPVFAAEQWMLDLHSEGPSDKRLRKTYKALAYGIPALSPAMGRTKEFSTEVVENLDDTPFINFADVREKRKAWGREDGELRNRWLHSDIKDMAFYYVHDAFSKLLN